MSQELGEILGLVVAFIFGWYTFRILHDLAFALQLFFQISIAFLEWGFSGGRKCCKLRFSMYGEIKEITIGRWRE